jgi:hypothetical protein
MIGTVSGDGYRSKSKASIGMVSKVGSIMLRNTPVYDNIKVHHPA